MTPSSCDLFLIAAEVSADLLGSRLIQSLVDETPALKICGIGGPLMRKESFTCLLPMEEFQVMGFIDVLRHLPKLIYRFYKVRRLILRLQPKAVVFIDYPGFNLRMATHLRRKKYSGKLCQYVSPSVWAWGKKRIPQMSAHLDLLLTILPFEGEYFQQTSLKTVYVGHPLVQALKLQVYSPLHLFYPQIEKKKVLGIFCGSRKKEILRNLPLQLRAACEVKKTHPELTLAISISQEEFLPLIQKIVLSEGIQEEVLYVPRARSYDLMQSCTLALAKSGTVTLELALHQVPTVVTYGVSAFDLFMARFVFRIDLPYYCLVNILAKEEVFPEYIGPDFTVEAVAEALERFLTDTPAYQHCKQKCSLVHRLLEKKESQHTASAHIQALLTP